MPQNVGAAVAIAEVGERHPNQTGFVRLVMLLHLRATARAHHGHRGQVIDIAQGGASSPRGSPSSSTPAHSTNR